MSDELAAAAATFEISKGALSLDGFHKWQRDRRKMQQHADFRAMQREMMVRVGTAVAGRRGQQG